jgi:putative hydrolase of the HAD superfamily
MTQAIKAVLLDYGGVIADEGFQNGLRGLAREQGIDPKRMMDVAHLGVYETGFVLGTGTEADFWAYMREHTGLKGDDADLSRRILDGFILRSWMMSRVRHWRAQGIITGILSDQSPWLDILDQRDHFYDAFDHVFNSYNIGKGKRDPSLFHDVTERLALAPGEILFVDDAKNNIENAQAAGWQTIRYVNRSSFDEAIRKYLPQPDSAKLGGHG